MSNFCSCGECEWCLPVENVVDEQKFQLIREMFINYSLEELKEFFRDK
jgi:hypothetical protein